MKIGTSEEMKNNIVKGMNTEATKAKVNLMNQVGKRKRTQKNEKEKT